MTSSLIQGTRADWVYQGTSGIALGKNCCPCGYMTTEWWTYKHGWKETGDCLKLRLDKNQIREHCISLHQDVNLKQTSTEIFTKCLFFFVMLFVINGYLFSLNSSAMAWKVTFETAVRGNNKNPPVNNSWQGVENRILLFGFIWLSMCLMKSLCKSTMGTCGRVRIHL